MLAASTALGACPGWLASAAEFASPDFSRDSILREVAGLRPIRTSGVRLEIEDLARKTIVHNYGHGGSGFTLAWGSAEEAADLLRGRRGDVAVVGGGVIGMTTAAVLRERGYRVRIYCAKTSPETTSDLAGAQWSPSFCSSGTTAEEKLRFNRMLKTSYLRYEELQGTEWAVFKRPNYIPDDCHDGLQDVAPGILEDFKRVNPMPFGRKRRSGVVVPSWLIEPPIFLPRLMQELRGLQVEFKRREFASVGELIEIPEPIVVNCCGLGAAALFADRDVIPMKGQLLWLKNPLGLSYVALHKGYTFCRRDAIVLGGSYQRGTYDTRVDANISAHILQLNKDFFYH